MLSQSGFLLNRKGFGYQGAILGNTVGNRKERREGAETMENALRSRLLMWPVLTIPRILRKLVEHVSKLSQEGKESWSFYWPTLIPCCLLGRLAPVSTLKLLAWPTCAPTTPKLRGYGQETYNISMKLDVTPNLYHTNSMQDLVLQITTQPSDVYTVYTGFDWTCQTSYILCIETKFAPQISLFFIPHVWT